jgi:hypothetical protein
MRPYVSRRLPRRPQILPMFPLLRTFATGSILTGYQKSQPPDMITYFQGIIGTMEAGLRWSHSEADLPDYSYGDPDFPKDFTELEAVLYQFITRRFLRSGVSHTAQGFTNREALENISAKNYQQAAFIRDYELYADPGASAFDRFIASLKRLAQPVLATVGIKLPLNEEGIMIIWGLVQSRRVRTSAGK